MFNDLNTVVSSGVFICKPLFFQAAQISSPYVRPNAPLEPEFYDEGIQITEYVEKMKHTPRVYPMSSEVVAQYASKIVEISRIIAESQFDLVLCPLRGARLPGFQSKLICLNESFESFDGSDMGKRMNSDRILQDVREIIVERPCIAEKRKIGILDTAVGGDSCREFTRILRQLNDEIKEPWDIQFHLIHAAGRQPPRAAQAYGFRSENLEIQLHFHDVIDLLIEDETGMLGYDVERGYGSSQIFKFQQEGQIMLYGHNKVTTYRKAPLDETMIALLAKEIMNQIQTIPDIKPVNLEDWPYGV